MVLNSDVDVGDSVIVPEPWESDLHNHSFQGTVIDINDEDETASVEDQEGSIFEIELYRLELVAE